MRNWLKATILYAPFIVILLAVVEIILANQLAGSGKTIRSVDIAIDSLRDENKLLEQQIASASSLLTVESRAKQMGFIEPKSTQYVTLAPDQLPVAFNTSAK